VVRESGVYLVAQSYGWIFRRNCVNLGVLPLQSTGPVKIQDGSEVELDLSNLILKETETGRTVQLMPIPKIILEINKAGGLVGYLNSHKEYSL
jgi:3-isopropylmalate/(R)-2-methylmalate dehydratase small subunit